MLRAPARHRMRLIASPVYRAFPELDSFSDVQCREFTVRARGSWRRRTTFGAARARAAIAAVPLTVWIVAATVGSAIGLRGASSNSWVLALVLLAGLLAGGATWLVFGDLSLRLAIRRVMRIGGTCQGCGYVLVGLPVSASLDVTCPRIVSLAAIGGAMVELALTCAARQGCTVSGIMSVAGACSSLGNASAALDSRTVSGTATYRSLEQKVKVSGRIGANVEDDGFGIDGQISSEQEWELDGDGSVVGAAMYAVTHDRTYCAFTNRAYVLRTSGQASAVASGTVADNGTVAVNRLAVVLLAGLLAGGATWLLSGDLSLRLAIRRVMRIGGTCQGCGYVLV
ncbi:MAG: hypothetical protein ACKORL_10160, partial [Phycisphaerales bacterium]